MKRQEGTVKFYSEERRLDLSEMTTDANAFSPSADLSGVAEYLASVIG